MKSVINKDIETFFLYKEATYSTDKSYNLILSPEFYWCRIFEIPVNSKKKIQKILPTLFEDILPHSEFEYYSIKLEDKKFICFAFESDVILNKIKQCGLHTSKLQNIYFAQTELLNLAPFKIDEQSYIKKDEILIQIPNKFLKDDTKSLDIKNVKLSNHKIKLNIHQNMLSLKNTYLLAAVFILISLTNLITIISLSSESDQIDLKKENIIKEYKLPQTSIQINSILNSLKTTDEKQLKLRALLFDIFNIHKRYPNSKIAHINYAQKLTFIIENIDFSKLKNELKGYNLKQLSKNNSTLKVEISL